MHIATHGCFRQDNPMFSSISLGDSHLSLFDLYQLDLPCELVTLSGCGTGLNMVVGGDELLGLVRGLLYAGAQGVLVTLWDVNDQSTAEFMKLFYEALRANGNKARGVQEAMSEIRRRYAHPYYWAPFSPGREIPVKKSPTCPISNVIFRTPYIETQQFDDRRHAVAISGADLYEALRNRAMGGFHSRVVGPNEHGTR